MKQRHATRLDTDVSEIGFGAWAIGGSWGEVAEAEAEASLNAALDAGVNFIDTANVYGAAKECASAWQCRLTSASPHPPNN